jgi:regulator of nucleoside diphosphate kinase
MLYYALHTIKHNIMENQKNQVIISEEDFNLIKPYLGSISSANNEMSLAYEISRAKIVKKDAVPSGTIKLNSHVKILDLGTQDVMEFTIVLPSHADIKTKKISVVTPMGAALIGFKIGDEVEWKVPAGLKKFSVQDVVNT